MPMDRPLIALLIDSLNLPAPGFVSFFVSHCTRRPPSLLNDSVCTFPWPDQEPSVCHVTTSCFSGGGGWLVQDTSRAARNIGMRDEGRGMREQIPPASLIPPDFRNRTLDVGRQRSLRDSAGFQRGQDVIQRDRRADEHLV